MKIETITVLKDDVLNKIKANALVQAHLCKHFNVSVYTIQRWIKINHSYLSFVESLIIISQELNTLPTDLTVEVESEVHNA